MFVLLAASSAAHAFCGTYVGSAEDSPTNSVSEVAIVRSGNQTTLTVSNDIQGDTTSFAMVVPVPEILLEEALHVVSPDVFTRLDAYSAPRAVSYACGEGDSDTDADSDTDTDLDTGDTGDVDVEAEYIVGEYDVKILSATESTSLVTWLQTNGYQVPDASAALLGEYIEAGSFFLAAQVREDAGIASGDTLSPLQFSYSTEVYGLPIRIGTLNSPGLQELRIYAINDSSDGAVGISNYPQATPQNDCMYCDENFSGFYGSVLDEAFAGDQASWIEEYSWNAGSCDPCSSDPPSEADILSLGWTAGGSTFLTRLRMRYTPEQTVSDLSLYLSGSAENRQLKYIVYDPQLEETYPMCFTGFAESPGTCDDDWTDQEREDSVEACLSLWDHNGDSPPDDTSDTGASADECGCVGTGLGAQVGAGSLLALGALWRRRRTPSASQGTSA